MYLPLIIWKSGETKKFTSYAIPEPTFSITKFIDKLSFSSGSNITEING